jgi:hypothetical protein
MSILAIRAFKDFMEANTGLARMVDAPSGVVYVFLAAPRDYDRALRKAELGNRCFVARGLHGTATTVVGVATWQYRRKGSRWICACCTYPTGNPNIRRRWKECSQGWATSQILERQSATKTSTRHKLRSRSFKPAALPNDRNDWLMP